MKSMFENCTNLKSLDLSHFNTLAVSDLSYMFNNCSSLESLKINFNTTKVVNMERMFSSCVNLTSLNLSSFNTTLCNNFNNMFENDKDLDIYIDEKLCSNLINQLPGYVHPHGLDE